MKNIMCYGKKHFWFPIGMTFILTVFVMAVIFQVYLRSEYFNYLLQEAYNADQTILEAEQSSMNVLFPTLLQTGSELAINKHLYYYVNNAIENPDSGNTQYYLHENLKTVSHYSSDILQLAVVTEDGLLYQYNGYYSAANTGIWTEKNEEKLSQLYEMIFAKLRSTTKRYEIVTESNSLNKDSDVPLLSIAYPIMGSQTVLKNVKAVLVVTYQLDFLKSFFEIQDSDDYSYTIGFLSNQDKRIIYHDDEEYIGKNVDTYLKEKKLSVLSLPLEKFGWDINIAVNSAVIRDYVNQLYRKGVAIYIILLMIIVSAMIYAIRRSMRPVAQINTAIKTVRKGELNQKIEIHGEHEIWQLAKEYNKMIDSLKEQQRKTEEENQMRLVSMRRANDAEREALESQINAHFLCNTLGAINYSAIEAGNEEVSLMLRKLSNILRYTFSSTYSDVTVAQELAWVEQYLYLQKFRLMDVFDYSIEFPEQYDAWPCCKLFLQPFVENSIAHGFEGLEKGGIIKIIGKESGNRLEISLEDNGSGIPEEKLGAIQAILDGNMGIDLHGVGIGIRNVVTRLRMFYGEGFEVYLETGRNRTKFTFLLPIPSNFMVEEEDEF